ncbi:DUF932 domain-containing protein [Candidatus Daviesbacteria bacterium]|nr:DUF932 domain-containing protein [Candidatus Daviesbacteria bacterium]
MPAELFGERFYSNRAPAWHNLGLVLDTPMSAVEAFRRVGSYTVHLDDLVTEDAHDLKKKLIVRDSTVDDQKLVVFGIVDSDYNVIQPEAICRVWDEFIIDPVETLGVLREGRLVFVTTQLESFSLNKEDDVDNYLILVHSLTAAPTKVMVSPVRVVCQNTLTLAEGKASKAYKFKHTISETERIGERLVELHNKSKNQIISIKEAFEMLTKFKVGKETLDAVLDNAYPFPVEPDNPTEEELGDFEKKRSIVTSRRNAINSLFNGDATGGNLQTAKGTAWGLYNSITEFESFRSGYKDEAIGYDSLLGGRARTKAIAYKTLMSLARKEVKGDLVVI